MSHVKKGSSVRPSQVKSTILISVLVNGFCGKNIHHFVDQYSAFLPMLIQYIPSMLHVIKRLLLRNDISRTDEMDKMNFCFCFQPTE